MTGDIPGLVEALHQLTYAGLLPPSQLERGRPVGSCPRCGRSTSVADWCDIPSVCCNCRAEWMTGQVREGGGR